MTWKEKLKALKPCPEAYRWACQYSTLRQAWRACEEGEWMMWLVGSCEGWQSDTFEALLVAIRWGCRPGNDWVDETLCDAYCVFDFMPDPPELP